jgi:glyoxylase-like metal-dependent hydrolase (beta-lactamase superfamily II)
LSVVVRQPTTEDENAAMWRATLACPTQSIGTISRRRPPAGVFPWRLTDGVHLCGYNDESSFGAHSYFLQRDAGNLLVDSPRWTRALVEAFEARGGVAHVLLTHRDDVADADRYAAHFGARVWIHRADADAAPYATDVVDGDAPVDVAPGVRTIPAPGHTEGSMLYHVDREHLFTGDTLYFNEHRGSLDVFGGATWFSWTQLTESMARLPDLARFSWVLPGHGKWGTRPADEFDRQLRTLAADMRASSRRAWDRRP